MLSAVCDVVSRLALPAAVIGLARGASEPALVASILASAASGLRSWFGARAVERCFVVAWQKAADAARRRPAEELPRRREDEESVALFMQGVSEHASLQAVVLPQIAGLAATTLGLTVASFVVLGAVTTLAGGALLGAIGGFGLFLARGLRRSQRETWTSFGRLSLEMRVLLEGGLELRAAGREAHRMDVVVATAREVAKFQARTTAASLRMGLLPATLAVLVVAAPLRAGVARVQVALAGGRLLEVSVLGASALAVAVAAGRAWELWATTASVRETYLAFVAREGARDLPRRRLGRPLAEAGIQFRGFGHDWAASGRLTPRALDLALEGPGGVALTGPNGAGKTTAILGLLGALRPSRGAVEIGGVPAHEVAPEDLASRVGYVPQDPIIVPGESIAWHCRLYEDVPDEILDAALRATGLESVLDARARARGIPVRELPASELSGGERRKLALSRALQAPRALYVLDEPEAGLDATARVALRSMLEELAEHARVVVVAHDRAAIPASFREVLLEAEKTEP